MTMTQVCLEASRLLDFDPATNMSPVFAAYDRLVKRGVNQGHPTAEQVATEWRAERSMAQQISLAGRRT